MCRLFTFEGLKRLLTLTDLHRLNNNNTWYDCYAWYVNHFWSHTVCFLPKVKYLCAVLILNNSVMNHWYKNIFFLFLKANTNSLLPFWLFARSWGWAKLCGFCSGHPWHIFLVAGLFPLWPRVFFSECSAAGEDTSYTRTHWLSWKNKAFEQNGAVIARNTHLTFGLVSLQAWKKRWFVLRCGRLTGDPDVLEYYKNDHAKKPIRVIDLNLCEQVWFPGVSGSPFWMWLILHLNWVIFWPITVNALQVITTLGGLGISHR